MYEVPEIAELYFPDISFIRALLFRTQPQAKGYGTDCHCNIRCLFILPSEFLCICIESFSCGIILSAIEVG